MLIYFGTSHAEFLFTPKCLSCLFSANENGSLALSGSDPFISYIKTETG